MSGLKRYGWAGGRWRGGSSIHQERSAPSSTASNPSERSEEHISLSDLVRNVESVRHVPSLVQGHLRNILLLSIAGNVLGLAALEFVIPSIQEVVHAHTAGGFFQYTGSLARYWLSFTDAVAPVLRWTIIVSLVLASGVVALSLGIRAPVHEPVHWMAWAGSLIPGASLLSFLLIVVLLAALVVITLVVWIILITIVLFMIGGFLRAMLEG